MEVIRSKPIIKVGDVIEFTDTTNEYYQEHALVTHITTEGIYVKIIDGHNAGAEGTIGKMNYKLFCGDWDA